VKSYQAQTTIGVPAQTVYDYVSDFAKHAEWSGNGLQVTKDSDGPVAVGTTYSTVAKQFGTQREHSTITELEPGRVFGWDSKGALGTVHHMFTMSPSEAGTDLTKTAEFVQRSFLAKVTSWKIGKDLPAGLRRDVERIKEHLESAKG
jgi:uncharacterized protein YndB with AHSA1/START domain